MTARPVPSQQVESNRDPSDSDHPVPTELAITGETKNFNKAPLEKQTRATLHRGRQASQTRTVSCYQVGGMAHAPAHFEVAQPSAQV